MAEIAPLAPLEPSAEPTSVVYGSWIRRVAAFILDWFVVIPLVILALIAGLDRLLSSDDLEGVVLIFGWPVIAVLLGGYFVGFHGGKRGQTLGKMLFGIAVRDSQTYLRIGYGKASGRLIVTILLWACLYIPGIVDSLRPLWDSRKQSFHDKIVGTVVVRV